MERIFLAKFGLESGAIYDPAGYHKRIDERAGVERTAAVPIFIVVLFFQKYLTEGMVFTGLKG